MMNEQTAFRSEGTVSRPTRGLRSKTLVQPQVRRKDEAPLELDSEVLFQGGRELHIRHKGSLYRLSITRFEKLLLTK
ncbi:hemin uptake protein HemP [Stappia sp.]|jgi:hemin uptake protein HemP|uniref:hemin uptake protein HemP n=1 Tax=Stappia sp. TaxID=1870903 RepID=UPI003A9A05B6